MNLVQTGGEFDLKNKSEWQYQYDKYHGNNISTEWDRNRAEFMYCDGRMWSSEQLGNYTFGYFGAAYGYGEEFLSFGAGMYQIASGTSNWKWMSSYWDDPIDNYYVRMGHRAYK